MKLFQGGSRAFDSTSEADWPGLIASDPSVARGPPATAGCRAAGTVQDV